MTTYKKLIELIDSSDTSDKLYNALKDYMYVLIYSTDPSEYYIPSIDIDDLVSKVSSDLYIRVINNLIKLSSRGISRYLKILLKSESVNMITDKMSQNDATDKFLESLNTSSRHLSTREIDKYIKKYSKYNSHTKEYQLLRTQVINFIKSYYDTDKYLVINDEYIEFLVNIIIDKL